MGINRELPKPFIKWVGGKRQLLPEIMARIPLKSLSDKTFAYVEPFVGGGAVFFHLMERCGELGGAVLNDTNARLIGVYRTIQSDCEALIAALGALEKTYRALDPAHQRQFYLEKRARFNTLAEPTVEQAALFILLNRTGFNGLYRENAHGAFNVPFGKYANPRICDAETLRADAVALRGTRLLTGDFEDALKALDGRPAFFYLDPPYKPISKTSSFNSYVRTPFDDAAQRRLCGFCHKLNRLGHRFLLSNSDPGDGFFDALYAGFRIERVQARRLVNADPAKRGSLTELLISNETP